MRFVWQKKMEILINKIFCLIFVTIEHRLSTNGRQKLFYPIVVGIRTQKFASKHFIQQQSSICFTCFGIGTC